MCRMCTSVVGCRAAASNVFLSATAGQAALDTVKAAAQRRRKAYRDAVRPVGASAERGVQYAGPIARSTSAANAADHASTGAFTSCSRAGIDSGLIDTEPSVLSGRRPSANGAPFFENGAAAATLFVDWRLIILAGPDANLGPREDNSAPFAAPFFFAGVHQQCEATTWATVLNYTVCSLYPRRTNGARLCEKSHGCYDSFKSAGGSDGCQALWKGLTEANAHFSLPCLTTTWPRTIRFVRLTRSLKVLILISLALVGLSR